MPTDEPGVLMLTINEAQTLVDDANRAASRMTVDEDTMPVHFIAVDMERVVTRLDLHTALLREILAALHAEQRRADR